MPEQSSILKSVAVVCARAPAGIMHKDARIRNRVITVFRYIHQTYEKPPKVKQVRFTGHEEHMGQLRNSGEVWTASPHMLSTTCKAP